QRDREAFSRFYDAFAGLALGLIRRILRDPAAAEEVLQEVFWQVWQEAERYDPKRGSPEAWLVMRAKTRAIDKLRAIRRREKTFVAPVDESVTRSDEATGENPGVAAEARGLVRSALDWLPEAPWRRPPASRPPSWRASMRKVGRAAPWSARSRRSGRSGRAGPSGPWCSRGPWPQGSRPSRSGWPSPPPTTGVWRSFSRKPPRSRKSSTASRRS